MAVLGFELSKVVDNYYYASCYEAIIRLAGRILFETYAKDAAADAMGNQDVSVAC